MKGNSTIDKAMKLTNTKIIVTAGILTLAGIVLAIAAEQQPAVKDSYFEPDTDKLRELPANLVVLRATHFPDSSGKIRHVHAEDGSTITRTLGRNVSLRETIGEACDCNPLRVILPPDSSKAGFDFLVTGNSDARKQLQAAIRKELGYDVRRQTRNTDVLLLKVENSRLPGMKISSDDEKPHVNYEDGKLHFTHQQLSIMVDGLSQGLRQTVLDRTGLTNYYDFSVAWNPDTEKKMHEGAFDPDGVKKVLATCGLSLEPDTAPLEMFIVEKAH
jgi:uncharacterized protein (TIGR03435 family)